MDTSIDLRSDTATTPTDSMRRAMANAEVGDDVLDEDPTVHELQEYVAGLFGMEDALLVTSGTQGNAVSLLSHTRHGDLVYAEGQAHVGAYEAGGYAALAGVTLEKVATDDGILTAARVQEAMLPYDDHYPNPALVWVENTHNQAGGVSTGTKQMAKLRELADDKKLKIHIDGARIFNAAVAQQSSVKELAVDADSVQFCLSKGLGAPVGSMVVGSTGFIRTARKKRKMLGGGLRQSGVIAAAGLIALREIAPKLAEDHAKARMLADGINAIEGVSLKFQTPETNLVFFNYDMENTKIMQFVEELAGSGIRITVRGGVTRLALHHQISFEQVRCVIQAMQKAAYKVRS